MTIRELQATTSPHPFGLVTSLKENTESYRVVPTLWPENLSPRRCWPLRSATGGTRGRASAGPASSVSVWSGKG